MDKRIRFALVALYLLLITSVEFGVPYRFHVESVFPYGKDEHWHLESLKSIYDLIKGESAASDGSLFTGDFFYPPAIYLLSVPFCLLAERVDYSTALVPYLAIWFMLNLGLYLLGRELGGFWAGVLAPIIFMGCRQLPHLYGVYNLQIPMCAWLPFLLMFAFRTDGFLKRKRTLAFFALLALSFLTYLWVVQFMLFPVVAVWLLYGRPYKKSFVNILLGAVVGFLIVSPYVLSPGIRNWLLSWFPGLMHIGRSSVELWSSYFVEGGLYYINCLFQEPLNWLLLIALPFLPFRDKRVLALLASLAGGFLLLHAFKNMYAERLVPLFVFSSVLLGCGIARAASWLKGAMVFVVLCAVCISFSDFVSDILEDQSSRSYDEFTMLWELEKDCRANPNTAYIWRALSADHIEVSLWLLHGRLTCLSKAIVREQRDPFVASDPGRRLVVIGQYWWKKLCPVAESEGTESLHAKLYPLLCRNRSKLKLLYSNPHYVFYEVPREIRLPPPPEE